ncbi:hypothetical protein HYV80_01470 [Candidatus Woesearchaeota archaeon]|nr:hypothetical protein [Candidatus Woesearchaeota archaeon]
MINNRSPINKKAVLLSALIIFSIYLSSTAFAAQDFIIENRTSALFVVNGTTGNIIMAPSFGMGVVLAAVMLSLTASGGQSYGN